MINTTKINLCPEARIVFDDHKYECKKYFKPLASIDLSLIDKSLSGQIYVIYFNDDPFCEESKIFQNEFCQSEKIVFDIVRNKYKFKADFRYFTTNDTWKQWLSLGDQSYNEFLERKNKESINPYSFIKNLNGKPDWLGKDQTPLNSKGIKMKFICQMNSEDIIDDCCGKQIYLFYDPTDNVAIQIHQFN
jgi:hypothetical protein